MLRNLITQKNEMPQFRLILTIVIFAFLSGCGGSSSLSSEDGISGSADSDTSVGGSTSGVSTANVECAYSYSAFNSSPSVNTTSTSNWFCDGSNRTLGANGIPDHDVGTFPNANNPNTISEQAVSATYTLEPVETSTATTLGGPRGAIGYVLNGFEPTLMAWAADGFPIYARHGYLDPMDASSGTVVIETSYQLKDTPDADRPAVALFEMGTFTQDYEYVEGLGDLDECNGRTGVTPEFPEGIYHYYATDGFPFLQRCVKGTP
jgi:hypothetical protein